MIYTLEQRAKEIVSFFSTNTDTQAGGVSAYPNQQ